jgi:hypothetical protein
MLASFEKTTDHLVCRACDHGTAANGRSLTLRCSPRRMPSKVFPSVSSWARPRRAAERLCE